MFRSNSSSWVAVLIFVGFWFVSITLTAAANFLDNSVKKRIAGQLANETLTALPYSEDSTHAAQTIQPLLNTAEALDVALTDAELSYITALADERRQVTKVQQTLTAASAYSDSGLVSIEEFRDNEFSFWRSITMRGSEISTRNGYWIGDERRVWLRYTQFEQVEGLEFNIEYASLSEDYCLGNISIQLVDDERIDIEFSNEKIRFLKREGGNRANDAFDNTISSTYQKPADYVECARLSVLLQNKEVLFAISDNEVASFSLQQTPTYFDLRLFSGLAVDSIRVYEIP